MTTNRPSDDKPPATDKRTCKHQLTECGVCGPATNRAEWEIRLLEFVEVADNEDACDIEVVEAEKRLRTAIRKALDDARITGMTQAALLAELMDMATPKNIGVAIRHAAAESRARGNDGD